MQVPGVRDRPQVLLRPYDDLGDVLPGGDLHQREQVRRPRTIEKNVGHARHEPAVYAASTASTKGG